jgi:hypothetical protein
MSSDQFAYAAAPNAAADRLDDLMTPRQAALWLGMSPAALQALRAAGGGPPFLRPAFNPAAVRYQRAMVEGWAILQAAQAQRPVTGVAA